MPTLFTLWNGVNGGGAGDLSVTVEDDELHAWERCRDALGEILSAEIWRQHIEPLRLQQAGSEGIVLECPDPTSLATLRRGFHGLLEHTVERVLGVKTPITFVLAQARESSHQTVKRGPSGLPVVELNERFTFETFVVGNNNQFAHSAARAVAEAPGRTRFNPLLMYGGSGLGKTHLLQAIGHLVGRLSPDLKVRYVPTEDFKNEYIHHVQHNKMADFAHFYRQETDVLLMDDIQSLVGREALQQEFFHLFNALHQSSRQIVLTSDCPPGELQGLEDRLVSRFQWGLSVDIQPPDRDTREAILRNKAQEENLDLSEEVIAYIAETCDTNIRVLEGIVRRLILEASLRGNDISLELAQEVVELTVQKSPSRRFSPRAIQDTVADFYQVDLDSLIREGRGTREVAKARQVAMYLCKQLTDLSLKSIGNHFGNRDHSTVIHAVRTTERSMQDSSASRGEIEQLLKILR